ncbi:hypothetical protein [Halonotius sp. GCM10025705]|uniref:hypothetical protein n=1 Tax=Halonotius sp. GCM10025705 TaxID=3252678 RepID=UPI0036D210E5
MGNGFTYISRSDSPTLGVLSQRNPKAGVDSWLSLLLCSLAAFLVRLDDDKALVAGKRHLE